uniref:Uncharacterized protein n=1 Tax=Tetraselmis chuii TaxID=63592 RepID=A0A7S1T475_9CHLO|mmetsp:Transcript_43703/g.78091  ORF Transcript_43703/g.78091 Transcript_43703/m.78091 type:complete len:132 (+) Transcript_43703:3-398(+)
MDTPSFGPPRGLHGLTTQRPGGQQLSNNFSTFRISSPAGSLPSSQPTTPGRPTTSTAFQGSAFLEDIHPPLSLGHHNHQYQQPHQQPGGVNIRQHMPHFHSLQQPTPDQLFDMLPSLMDPNYGHPRSDGGY